MYGTSGISSEAAGWFKLQPKYWTQYIEHPVYLGEQQAGLSFNPIIGHKIWNTGYI